jgi:hypothetical protein
VCAGSQSSHRRAGERRRAARRACSRCLALVEVPDSLQTRSRRCAGRSATTAASLTRRIDCPGHAESPRRRQTAILSSSFFLSAKLSGRRSEPPASPGRMQSPGDSARRRTNGTATPTRVQSFSKPERESVRRVGLQIPCVASRRQRSHRLIACPSSSLSTSLRRRTSRRVRGRCR